MDDQSRPVTVAEALLDLLELEGVDRVFCIPGGALLAILKELKARRGRLTCHICRHETGAAFMAHGYAQAGGGLGVVMVTSGPGATNALTGTMNADAARSAVLTVTGEVPSAHFGRGYLQEGVAGSLDVVGVYRSAIGSSEMITAASNFQEISCSALRVARGAPNRAAHLSIPNDVAASVIECYVRPQSPATYRATPAFVDTAGVEATVDAIVNADRPLLMLGNTCRRPLADPQLLGELIGAVEALALPVITEPDAKGIFPETHELSLRNYGMAGCEWPRHYMNDPGDGQYDVLVVAGSRLDQLTTNSWDPLLLPGDQLIQIDEAQSMIGRALPLTRGVVGEMGAVLRCFVDVASKHSVDAGVADRRRSLLAAIKENHSPFTDPTARDSTDEPIKPQTLIRLLNDVLPPASRIFVDSGNCVGWCLNGLVIDPPMRSHFSLTMGPMGFAVGAVIGGKLADPEATCVAVVGDGAFMMHMGEVSTAAEYGIGAIWIILVDHDYAMVSQGMAHFAGDEGFEHYYGLGTTDLARAAEGLGAAGHTVSDSAGVRAALTAAFEGARRGIPQVVAVTIDPSEQPPYYPPGSQAAAPRL
jgi:acetolactate synthase-1/2/3 large subunit